MKNRKNKDKIKLEISPGIKPNQLVKIVGGKGDSIIIADLDMI